MLFRSFIDDEDVTKNLRSTAKGARKGLNEWDWDHNAEARYNWVLEEMIWAFTQKTLEDDTAEFYDHSETHEPGDDLNTRISKLKVDRDGLKAHEDRKQNGYRLFGKYFQTLWT